MLVELGSYVGTGSAQSITFGWQPLMVLTKGGANVGCMRVGSMGGDTTKNVHGTAAVFFAGGITSLDATGFSVGTDARANANGTTYYFVAVGDDGVNTDCTAGSYTGTGAAGNAISGLGFAPNAVFIMENTANRLVYRTTAHGNGQPFDNAELTNLITSLDADGFTVGSRVTEPTANVNTNTYYYVALADVANVFAASLGWSGDSANPRTITGVGFDPQYAFAGRRTGGSDRVAKHYLESGSNCLNYNNNTEATNLITALTTDGFTCTAQAQVNATGSTYAGLFFRESSGGAGTTWDCAAVVTGTAVLAATANLLYEAGAIITGTATLAAVANLQWGAAATITGRAQLTATPTRTYALKAHITARADGYAHAEQPAPPALLDPYGGLST